MGLRRHSREIALQLLFQGEFEPKGTPEEQLAQFSRGFSIEPDALAYAARLATGIGELRDRIDALISGQSSHWKTSRMALVDLNVMRIAVFEMKFADPPVPPKVAIDEAIEIAKKYGSSDSGAFVNGILDQISKS